MKHIYAMLLLLAPISAMAQLQVSSTSPQQNSATSTSSTIMVSFNQSLNTTSPQASWIQVYSQYAGELSGSFGVSGSTITFDPDSLFMPGEQITVVLDSVEAAGGDLLDAYQFSFFAQSGTAPASPPFFRDIENLAVSNSANNVLIGDMNGDGLPDMIGTTSIRRTIYYIENEGGGAYRSRPISQGSDDIVLRGAVLGDFDGDGDMDIVTASKVDNRISLYSNDGTGLFTYSILFTSMSAIMNQLKVVDFDNDMDLDILGVQDKKLMLLSNDGSGNFSMSTLYEDASLAETVYAYSMGDMDQNGWVDVLLSITGSPNYFLALYREGTSTLSLDSIETSSSTAYTELVDINGDEVPEIIGYREASDKVRGFERTDSGYVELTITPTESVAYKRMKAADLDGDGDMDLLALKSSELSWYENDGTGYFNRHEVDHAIDFAYEVAVADWDGDGSMDLFTVASNSGNFRWYQQVAPEDQNLEVSYQGNTLSNGDTIYIDAYIGDVVELGLEARNSGEQVLEVDSITASANTDILGSFAGSFIHDLPYTAIGLQITTDTTAGQQVETFTIYSDDPDVAVFEVFVSLELAEELVITASPAQAAINVPQDTTITFSFSEDLPGDWSEADFLITGSHSGIITGAYSQPDTRTITFTPDANYKPGEDVRMQLAAGLTSPNGPKLQITWYSTFKAANAASEDTPIHFKDTVLADLYKYTIKPDVVDFDGDGQTEIIVRSAYNDYDVTRFVRTDSAYQGDVIAFDYDYYNYLRQQAYGDFNQDGKLDMAGGYNYLSVYSYQGGNAFQEEYRSVRLDKIIQKLEVADMDNDGRQDIIMLDGSSTNSIKIYYSKGNFDFDSVTYNSDVYLYDFVLMDIDNDGDLDITAASYLYVIAWYNEGGGNFAEVKVNPGDYDSKYLKAADMDQDGYLDVVISEPNGDIKWMRNTGSFETYYRSIAPLANGTVHSIYDYDQDGDLDLFYQTGNDIILLEQDTIDSFSSRTIYQGAATFNGFTLSDEDNDGDLDILLVTNKQLVLLQNSLAEPADLYLSSGTDTLINHQDTLQLGVMNPGQVRKVKIGLDNAGGKDVTITDFELSGPLSLTDSVLTVQSGITGYLILNVSDTTIGDLSGTLTIHYSGGVDSLFDLYLSGSIVEELNATLASPLVNSYGAARDAGAEVLFSSVMPSGESHYAEVSLIGEISGKVSTNVSVQDSSVTFSPARSFVPGEKVTLLLPAGLSAEDGSAMAANKQFSYYIGATAPDTTVVSFYEYNRIENYYFTGLDLYDLNADEQADILSVKATNLTSFEQDGDYNFTESALFDSYDASVIQHADMDGDGDLDFVTLNFNLVLHTAEGGSYTQTILVPAINNSNGEDIIVANLNGDQLPDILVMDASSIYLLINNGNGQFSKEELHNDYSYITAIEVGDVNGDNFPDIFLADYNNGGAWVYFNDGYGFFERVSVDLDNYSNPQQLILSDFDGDNKNDLLALYRSRLFLWTQVDSVTYTADTLAIDLFNASSMDIGDIDGDGDIDVLLYETDGNDLSWIENNAGVYIKHAISVDLANTGDQVQHAVRLADLDNDGVLDVAALGYDGSQEGLYIFGNYSPDPLGMTLSYQDTLLSSGDTIALGTFAQGNVNAISLILKNTSDYTLVIDSLSAESPLSVPDTLTSLGRKASSDLGVSLDFNHVGSFESTVYLSTNDTIGGPYSITITGEVIATALPEVMIDSVVYASNSVVDLGTINNGTIINFVIANKGAETLSIADFYLGSPFTLLDTVPSELAPAAEVLIRAEVAATNSGVYYPDFSFSHNAEDSIYQLDNMSVNVPANPVLQVVIDSEVYQPGDTLYYPVTAQDISVTKTVTLKNTGFGSLSISEVLYPFEMYANLGSSVTLNSGNSVELSASFLAYDFGTTFTYFSVESNDSGTPSFLINVVGEVDSVPELRIRQGIDDVAAGDSLVFGTIEPGDSLGQTYTIRNLGSGTLYLDSLSLPTGYSTDLSLPLALEPDAESNFRISFVPVNTGNFDGSFVLYNNDSDEGEFNLLLFGDAVLQPSMHLLAFGDTIVSGQATPVVIARRYTYPDFSLPVINSGAGELIIDQVDVPSGWVFNTALPLTLAAGADTTLSFSAPYAGEGIHTGSFILHTNQADAPTFELKAEAFYDAGEYTFRQQLRQYQPVPDGTVISSGSIDDGTFDNNGDGFPIGFNFNMAGKIMTVFAVDNNGWIKLDSGSISISGDNNFPLDNGSDAYNYTIAAASDLLAEVPEANISYKTIGEPGRRTLIVQWEHYGFYSAVFGQENTVSFQIRLHEGSNEIELHFDRIKSSNGLNDIQAGWRGASTDQVYTRQVIEDQNYWENSKPGDLYSRMDAVPYFRPVNNLSYVWGAPRIEVSYMGRVLDHNEVVTLLQEELIANAYATLVVRNTGGGQLNVYSYSSNSDLAFSTIQGLIAPGDSAIIKLALDENTDGQISTSLGMYSNAVNYSYFNVGLRGEYEYNDIYYAYEGQHYFRGDEVNIGSLLQGVTTTRDLYIINGTADSVHLNALYAQYDYTYSVQAIAPGDSILHQVSVLHYGEGERTAEFGASFAEPFVNIPMTYTGTMEAGIYADLRLYFDGVERPLEKNTYTFLPLGTGFVGDTLSHTLTLSNETGTDTLFISDIFLPNKVAFVDTLPYYIAPGESFSTEVYITRTTQSLNIYDGVSFETNTELGWVGLDFYYSFSSQTKGASLELSYKGELIEQTSTIDLGTRYVSEHKYDTILVNNPTAEDILVTGLSVNYPFFIRQELPDTLQSGQSYEFTLGRYTDTGVYQSSVSLETNDTVSYFFDLRLVQVADPTYTMVVDVTGNTDYTGGTYIMGYTDQSTAVVGGFSISNTGNQVIKLDSIVLSDGITLSGNDTASIAAEGVENFSFTFNPTALGTFDETITIYSNETNSPKVLNFRYRVVEELAPQLLVRFLGADVADAEVVNIGYYPVNEAFFSNVYFFNEGYDTLEIPAITMDGAHFYWDDSTTIVLPPQEGVTRVLNFGPVAENGVYTARIDAANNTATASDFFFEVSIEIVTEVVGNLRLAFEGQELFNNDTIALGLFPADSAFSLTILATNDGYADLLVNSLATSALLRYSGFNSHLLNPGDTVYLELVKTATGFTEGDGSDAFTFAVSGDPYTINYTYELEEVVNGLSKEELAQLRLYPNPARQTIYLSGDLLLNGAEIMLLDAQGRVLSPQMVLTPGDNRAVLNVQDLPAGIYLIRVLTEDGVTERRFLKK